jgi:uncharacterized protein YjbI with pentapeptide repeats
LGSTGVIRAQSQDVPDEVLAFFGSDAPDRDSDRFWRELGFWYQDAKSREWQASWHGFVFPDADFRDATFTGRADFGKATFSGDVDFQRATFSGDAYFGDATFSGDAGFGEATFSEDATFVEATFKRRADFWHAIISGDAYFGIATFSGEAHFRNATFFGQAHFRNATFSGDAVFGKATFSGDVDFGKATFSRDAYFRSATFTGNAYFDAVTFTWDANFTGASFTWYALFASLQLSVDNKDLCRATGSTAGRAACDLPSGTAQRDPVVRGSRSDRVVGPPSNGGCDAAFHRDCLQKPSGAMTRQHRILVLRSLVLRANRFRGGKAKWMSLPAGSDCHRSQQRS